MALRVHMTQECFHSLSFVSTPRLSLINRGEATGTELVTHTALMSHDQQPESLEGMFFHGSRFQFVLCRYLQVMSLGPASVKH
jgi:hypothetical protein